MKNEFIITSTNNIEGGSVNKYLGVINNNVVVGTNLFSDIGASILDIFGGTSSSYQNKLKTIYESSVQNLKVKAKNLGANAILGLSIDFDEISGGNKSMFMISVSGTAVVVEYTSLETERISTQQSDYISIDVLKNELIKRRIVHKAQNEILLSQEEWYFIQQNPILKTSENLLRNFFKDYGSFEIPKDSDKGKTLLNNITNYFRALENEEAKSTLYSKLIEKPDIILEILHNINLFSSEYVLKLIEDEKKEIAIRCLNINKENYSKEDLKKMGAITHYFENFENKGEISTSTSILNKAKEKYICPNGHSNNVKSEYCEIYNCSKNIKGLTEKQVERINYFKHKTETLHSLFNPI